MTTAALELDVLGTIKGQLPNANIRQRLTDWGLIVEVVDNTFAGPADDAYKRVSGLFRALEIVANRHGETVWKLCTAPSEALSFNVNATLRTVASGPDERGVWTSILMAADTYLDITEFDAELLLANASREVVGVEALTDDGSPLLSFKESSKYVSLEVEGHQYRVASTELIPHPERRRVLVRLYE